MAFNINDIRSQLTGGGARSNLYQIELAMPATAGPASAAASQKLTFTCRATQLPGATVSQVPISYFGREIKLAGNRTFEDWSVTVFNDEDFLVFDALNGWMNTINTHEGNIRTAGASPISYQTTADVVQYGKQGDEIKRIKLVNLWPTNIAAMDLSWDAADAIQDFTVTWAFDYWTNEGITS
jgi:hypothetical protein